MSGVISLTILLVIYAVSELISRKTNGIIDTVLTIFGLSWLLDWNSPEEPLYQWWCRSIRDGSSWIDVNVIRNHY